MNANFTHYKNGISNLKSIQWNTIDVEKVA